LKIGEKFRTRVDESIHVYDKLMVILTEHSLASPWVEEEVEAALEKAQKHSGKLTARGGTPTFERAATVNAAPRTGDLPPIALDLLALFTFDR